MRVKRLLALLFALGLLGPGSGAVLCMESDGRIAVEPGIGGRCADLVLAQRSAAELPRAEAVCDDEAPCRDSLLPPNRSTLSRDQHLDDRATSESLPSPPSEPRLSAPHGVLAAGLCELPHSPPQLAQIASVVILR